MTIKTEKKSKRSIQTEINNSIKSSYHTMEQDDLMY